MRNTAFEHDHVRDYRKHDTPVLATHTVWQPHHGEEIISRDQEIAALKRSKIALKCAVLSALHLLDGYDRYDAEQLELLSDSLRSALRVAS